MAKIFYLHWNEAELAERIKPLLVDGHEIISHWSTETGAKVGEPYPAALVVSLDRLPSHGPGLWRMGLGSQETPGNSSYF